MKNILLFIMIFSFYSINTNAYSKVISTTINTNDTITENFDSIKLRHGHAYNFSDTFVTKNNKVGLSKYSADFDEKNDYNGKYYPKNGDGFGWTQEIINSGYIIEPNDEVEVFESKKLDEFDGKFYTYIIRSKPLERKTDNLHIKYTAEYYILTNGLQIGPNYHIENQPYEITWCGDGIRDEYIDIALKPNDPNRIINETCDPGDTINKEGWGNNGCSNTCEPVVAQPVCNSLSYETIKNPIKIGTDNTTKTVSCKATNAEKIKIDCGNGVTETFTGQIGSKTVSKSCNYTAAGTYTPKCYVDDTISNFSCESSLTVLNPTPDIEITKSDFNSDDEDGIIGDDSQTVIKGNKAKFKIVVKNIGGENLKNVVITDAVEPSCNRTASQTKSLYSGDEFAKGDSFSYNCEKPNTQSNYTNTANVSGKGVISDNSINDNDSTDVKVVVPSCNSLNFSPDFGTIGLESEFNCNANYTNNYKILIERISGDPIISGSSIISGGAVINDKYGKIKFPYSGGYIARCFIDNKNTTEQACIKTITINPNLIPSISIDKKDNNPNDRDGGVSDTQTVYKGNKAVFKITVTNNGNEDLKNVIITDDLAPDCNKNSSETLALYTGNLFSVGDSFTYNCEKSNTQSNYTNTATVNAKGVGTNNDVDDTDSTDIKIVEPVCTGLNIDKNSGDVSFSSNFTCTGNNVDTYKILVKDSNGNIVNESNSNVSQYNFNTVGSYSVECYLNNKNQTENVCKKTITANQATNPNITIDKTDDNNLFDIDGQIGNDIQIVKNGNKAVFRIKVTNNGTEDLTNIILTDANSPNCQGSVNLPSTIPSTFNGFTISGNGDYTNNILEPGESFEYTCEKPNTTVDYTNSATVKANSTKDNSEVDDTDITEVKTGTYDLALFKKVVNKKVSYKKGDLVTFEIIVENQGTIDANNVSIIDYIPTGLELSDATWTQSGSFATRNIGDVVTNITNIVNITFKITANSGDITNWAEINSTSDNLIDCDSTPDGDKTNDTFITDNLIGNSCGDTNGDEDDHDPATITVIPAPTPTCDGLTIDKTSGTTDFTSNFSCIGTNATSYKILVKDLSGNILKTISNSKGSYNFTDKGNYSVECSVNGNITSNVCKGNVEKTEIINNQCSSDITGSLTGTLDGTETGLCNIVGQTVENFSGATLSNITNYNWSCKEGLDIYTGGNCNASYDPGVITTLACGTNDGVRFHGTTRSWPINGTFCKNGTVVNSDNPEFPDKNSSVEWSCENGIDPIKKCSATRGGTSGGSALCYNIENLGSNQFKCTGNGKTKSIGIDCDRDGIYEQAIYSNNNSYTFTCSGFKEDGVTPQNINPICGVEKNEILPGNSAGWNTSNQCKYKANNICGDGVVQSPNSNGKDEQCDGGKNCESDCTLKTSPPHSKDCNNSFEYFINHLDECTNDNPDCGDIEYYKDHKNDICKTVTRPTGGELSITTVDNFLIGTQNVFDYNDDKNALNYLLNNNYLKAENVGDEPLLFKGDKLCIVDMGDSSNIGDKKEDLNVTDGNRNLITNDIDNGDGKNVTCDTQVIDWIYPGETKFFRKDLSHLKGKPSSITSGKTSEINRLVLTIKDGETNKTFEWSPILAGNIFVTVAKPSISSQGGGITYLSGSTEISSINEIASKIENINNSNPDIDTKINNKQKNFISTVLSEGTDLSNVDTISGDLKTSAETESTDLENNANEVVENSTSSITTSSITNGDISSFTSYRGIENVYFVKDKNITLPTKRFTERKTYIIENGNLTIEGNIESTKNIAFIVKNGNIIINDSVTKIDGTYVNIGGEIKGENKISEQLRVNGTLYGNTTDLVSKRTHISMDSEGNISVGTIISYGSNLLNKPAPLVGKFINEYLSSEKIAQ